MATTSVLEKIDDGVRLVRDRFGVLVVLLHSWLVRKHARQRFARFPTALRVVLHCRLRHWSRLRVRTFSQYVMAAPRSTESSGTTAATTTGATVVRGILHRPVGQ